MKNFTAYLLKYSTTPLVNIFFINPEEINSYWEDERKLRNKIRKSKLNLTAFHKKALGKPMGTFTSEYRYAVWEGGDTATWRVFVNDKKGIGFEVPEDYDLKMALQAWTNYRDTLLTYLKETNARSKLSS